MASVETGPISSLTAIRKVVLPNPALRDFRTQLKKDAETVFGYSRVHSVELPTGLADDREPQDETDYEDVGVVDADFFSLHSIRVVLFARRARASQEVNDLLSRAHYRFSRNEFFTGRVRHTLTGRKEPVAKPNELSGRLREIQNNAGFPNGNLPVLANGVSNVSEPGASEQLYRLMLRENMPFSEVLFNQHDEIETASRGIQAAKGLIRGGRFDTESDPLGLDIIRLPGGQNRETQKFELAMNMRSDIGFELGPVEWRLKLSEPE